MNQSGHFYVEASFSQEDESILQMTNIHPEVIQWLQESISQKADTNRKENKNIQKTGQTHAASRQYLEGTKCNATRRALTAETENIDQQCQGKF